MKLQIAILCLAFPFISACIDRGNDSKKEAESETTVDPQIDGIGDLEPGAYTVHSVSSGATSPEEGVQVGWVSITESGRVVRRSQDFPSPQWVGNLKLTNDQDFEWSENFVDWRNGTRIHEPNKIRGTIFSEKTFATPDTSGSLEKQLLYVKVDQNTSPPPTTLEELSATYTGYNVLIDNRLISLTIDSSGAITGADDKGCVFNGQVSNLSPNHSIFNIDFEAENCPGDTVSASQRNGEFSGIGILDQTATAGFYGGYGTFSIGSTRLDNNSKVFSFFVKDDDFAYHFLSSASLLQMQRLREVHLN